MPEDIVQRETARVRKGIQHVQEALESVESERAPLSELDEVWEELGQLEGSGTFLERRTGDESYSEQIQALRQRVSRLAQQRVLPQLGELEQGIASLGKKREEARQQWDASTPPFWDRLVRTPEARLSEIPIPEYLRGVDDEELLRHLREAERILQQAKERLEGGLPTGLPRAVPSVKDRLESLFSRKEELTRRIAIDLRLLELERRCRQLLFDNKETIAEASQARAAVMAVEKDPVLNAEPRWQVLQVVMRGHYAYRKEIILEGRSTLASEQELGKAQQQLLEDWEQSRDAGSPLVDWVDLTSGAPGDRIPPTEAITRLRQVYTPKADERARARQDAAQGYVKNDRNPLAALLELRDDHFAPFRRLISQDLQEELAARRAVVERLAQEQEKAISLTDQADRIHIPLVDGLVQARSAWAKLQEAKAYGWAVPDLGRVEDRVAKAYADQLTLSVERQLRRSRELVYTDPEGTRGTAKELLQLLDDEAPRVLHTLSPGTTTFEELRSRVLECLGLAEKEIGRRGEVTRLLTRAMDIVGSPDPPLIQECVDILRSLEEVYDASDQPQFREFQRRLSQRQERAVLVGNLRLAVLGGDREAVEDIRRKLPAPWEEEVEELFADAERGRQLEHARASFEDRGPSRQVRRVLQRIAGAPGRFQAEAQRLLDQVGKYERNSRQIAEALASVEPKAKEGWLQDRQEVEDVYSILREVAGLPGTRSQEVSSLFAKSQQRLESMLLEELQGATDVLIQMDLVQRLCQEFNSEEANRQRDRIHFRYYKLRAEEAARTARDLADWRDSQQLWSEAKKYASPGSAELARVRQGLQNALEGLRKAELGTNLELLLGRPQPELTELAARLSGELQEYTGSAVLEYYLAAVHTGLHNFSQAMALAQEAVASGLQGSAALESRIREEQDLVIRQERLRRLLREPTAQTAQDGWRLYDESVRAYQNRALEMEEWWQQERERAAGALQARVEGLERDGARASELLPHYDALAFVRDRTGTDERGAGPRRSELRNQLEREANEWLVEIQRCNPMELPSATFKNEADRASVLASQVHYFDTSLENSILQKRQELTDTARDLATMERAVALAQDLMGEAKRSGNFTPVRQALADVPQPFNHQPYHRRVRTLLRELERAEGQRTSLEALLGEIREKWEDAAQEDFPTLARLVREVDGLPGDESGLVAAFSLLDPITQERLAFDVLGPLVTSRQSYLEDIRQRLERWERALHRDTGFQSRVETHIQRGELAQAKEACDSLLSTLDNLVRQGSPPVPTDGHVDSRQARALRSRAGKWVAHIRGLGPAPGADGVSATMPWLQETLGSIKKREDALERAYDDAVTAYRVWRNTPCWRRARRRQRRSVALEAVNEGLRYAPLDEYLVTLRQELEMD